MLTYSWACGKANLKYPFIGSVKLGFLEAKAFPSGGYKIIGNGLKFFYGQVLAGDAIDNYKGCPGIGPQTAANLLAHCDTEQSLWEATFWAYVNKLGPEKGLDY